MKLHFPNPSRSFDEKHSRILFWGYDRTIEVSFFLEAAALKRIYPKMNSSESELLKAFDTARERICKVADKVYEQGGGGKGAYAYVLTAGDF
ncbi:MAG: DUF1488 domain-containing protein [Candidatus Thiodiazotropha lotti]|nr:DUF1488 domain-containing protein [Candidatus Thiodiazotropha lotti]